MRSNETNRVPDICIWWWPRRSSKREKQRKHCALLQRCTHKKIMVGRHPKQRLGVQDEWTPQPAVEGRTARIGNPPCLYRDVSKLRRRSPGRRSIFYWILPSCSIEIPRGLGLKLILFSSRRRLKYVHVLRRPLPHKQANLLALTFLQS